MFKIKKRNNEGRDFILKSVKKSINNRSDLKILDIGAGSGSDIFNINLNSKNLDFHAINCLENSELNRRLKIEKINLKEHILDIEKNSLPFKDHSIDIIIANQILEHSKEIFWIFHEISRVLKINGRLIIGTPNLASLHNRILLFCGVQPTCIKLNSGHIRGFTFKGILKFIDQKFSQGYELIDFEGRNFYLFPSFLSKILCYFFPKMSVVIFMNLKKNNDYKNSFLENVPNDTNFYIGKNNKI